MITPTPNADSKIIEELLSEYDLGASTRRYLFSLRNWLSSRPLTYRQRGALHRIRERARNRMEPTQQWIAMWSDEKREAASICAKYYIENPPYFDWLSHNILNNPDFIPTQEEYEKLTTNKYAIKVLNAYHSDAKYKLGDLMTYRLGAPAEVKALFEGRLAIIIKTNLLPITSAAIGAKNYMVLSLGNDTPFVVEERFIKKYKQKA